MPVEIVAEAVGSPSRRSATRSAFGAARPEWEVGRGEDGLRQMVVAVAAQAAAVPLC